MSKCFRIHIWRGQHTPERIRITPMLESECMMRVGQGAALFDMDGTLIDGDSDWLYLRWERKRGDVSAGEVLRFAKWLVQHALGVLDAERVAGESLRKFA